MINLSLWVLLFPLFGFVLLGVTGRALARPWVGAIACTACGLTFLFALSSFLSMLGTPAASRVSDQIVYTWVVSGDFQVSFGLLLDPLSTTMLLVITGVGFLVHLYSIGYMRDDAGYWRFFSFLNFFIFAMVLLVSADNFLFLLIGWGLVGLASFLLIGFWFQKRPAVAAAQKTLVINIIGDFGLMLAIFLIFIHFGTLSYMQNDSVPMGVFDLLKANPTKANAICLLLFLACAAKSAQLPLYMWLPDTVEGPIPVSALIQAATMVTAGVYLVARAHPLFEHSAIALNTVVGIGGATALFAAIIALFQLDIRRVLAYSTISQLGYMFMSEGVHDYSAGIFHLTTHAYFKTLLFLGVGAVIHALGGEEDMREMGGLRKRLPITFWTFLIAALAISGIPPLAGFWSNDEILSSLLAQASANHNAWSYVLWSVGLLTAGLTAFYMFRLVFGIFTGDYRGMGPAKDAHTANDEEEEEEEAVVERYRGNAWLPHIHEAPGVMTFPLILLGLLTVIGGLVGSFALFRRASWQPLANFLQPVFTRFTPVNTPVAPLSLQWLSTGLSVGLGLLGILGAWAIYRHGFQYKERKNPFYQLVFHTYYVDEILTVVLMRPILWIGRMATRWLEGGVLDDGSRGTVPAPRGISTGLRRLQTGYVRNYALAIPVVVILIIVYYAVMKG